MSIISDRIDYLRVTIPQGDAFDETAWKLKTEEIFMSFCVPQGDKFTKWGNFERYYDNSLRTWCMYFECWGPPSDSFFNEVPRTHYGTILRVDLRFELDRPGIRIDTLEHVARRNKGKSRRTITRIDSPPRSKKGDRDAGGDFFAVGSKGSERRFTVYKRGDENWAVEVQFGKGAPTRFLHDAKEVWLNGQDYGPDFGDCFRRILYTNALEAITDLSYFSAYSVLGEVETEALPDAIEYQESLLAGLEMNLGHLDGDALSVAASALSRELDRRAILKVEDLTEPEGFWPVE